MISTRTYSYSLPHDDRFYKLAVEAGEVYSKSLTEFWKVVDEGVWMNKYELQAHMKDKIERKCLNSNSYIAAIHQVSNNISAWKQAKKVCPETKPPHKTKHLQPIVLKQEQITLKGGKLRLSIGRNSYGDPTYYFLSWDSGLPVPVHCTIQYDSLKREWRLSAVIKTQIEQAELDPDRAMSIDLGVKRIATIFDGEQVVTVSGKKVMGITHYQNKIKASNQSRLSKKKRGSKRKKKFQKSCARKQTKIKNQKKDLLHKASRAIVDYAVDNKIGRIVIGDCASIHQETNLGKNNNQQVQQNPEQQLRRYVEEKFECISGAVDVVPEPYTSQTCPNCQKKNKPKDRTYCCKSCGFKFDRDGVGAINIYNENVSARLSPGRIRCLSQPVGVKFKRDNQLLLTNLVRNLRS